MTLTFLGRKFLLIFMYNYFQISDQEKRLGWFSTDG